ncbi:hypothetical protein [Oceanobacillus profundus]|uniref:hypothetical protein n=1 Tax=Oceanobacillus profundus TaxID=372463 RepID=UPI0026E480AB|nr:hypothetical protein [Oceanobacillus profundus]MDO6451714.1 hypothetical protein [Oceanobacillus profundus]
MENKLVSENGNMSIGTLTGELKIVNAEIEKELQLDRIEKKMDRILELLEGKELSISFEETHGVSIEKLIQSACGALK